MARIAGVILHLLMAAVAATAVVPSCPSQLVVAPTIIRPKVVHPGGPVTLATRIHNKGATAVTGLGVRLDVPVGVVPSSEKSSKGMIIASDGGTSRVYWVGLTIKPRRRSVLKLRARICSTAPPGQYSVSGAIYRVNATNGVSCLTPLATSITVSSRDKPVPSKAPACPTPAPTPAGNQPYALVASSQRCAEAVLVGNVGAGRRRLEADGDAVASACWTLCVISGYTSQFYFNTQASSGDCYCCYTCGLVYDPTFSIYEAKDRLANYAYVSNLYDNSVSKCAFNRTTAELLNCSITATGFNQPYGITGDNGYVYVANYANSAEITKCTISTEGELTACIGTGSGFSGPLDFAFYGNWGYVANGIGSYVSKCDVTATGEFTGCVNAASVTGSAYGAGVVRDTLYITNANANTVTKCDIDPASGSLSNCGTTGTVEARPYSISFYMRLYAYIANESSRTVTLCKIYLDGSLVDCVNAGYSKNDQVNYSVVTGNYLLLTAFNSGLVYRCNITPSTGLLTDCISVGTGFNGPIGMTVG